MRQRDPSDRRKSVRYTLKSDFYLVFRPAFDRLGTVKDLSMGGVAFEYPVFDHQRELDDTREIDIFSSRPHHFMLRQVPCRVVYDVKLEQPSVSGLETRRCGIKFESLSAPQRQQLKELIGSYAARRLPASFTPSQSSLSGHSPSVD